MKRKYVFLALAALFALAACEDDDRNKMSADYPANYDLDYTIRQVMQYDEVNINGIDVAPRFAFFESFRLTIHYTDSKISAITMTNGDVPFSPYNFELPSGKVDAYLDTDVLPNELRISSTNKVVAYYQSGEFSVPFGLDCPSISYKYTFKSVNP